MNTQRSKIQYRGSLFWLIFWVILFFPIALVLFFTGTDFIRPDGTYRLHYHGSRFWLCFWVLLFFPVAILLFFLNGFSVQTTTP